MESKVKSDEVKENTQVDILLDILNLLRTNKSPSEIKESLGISKQLLYYHLRRLKQQGLVDKVGYGVWEVKSKVSTKVATSSEVRGHAFMWKVKSRSKVNYIKILESKGINYNKIKLGCPSILFNDRKIWLGKENIIIFEPESFIGSSAVDTRKYAVLRLIEVLQALEKELGINLRPYEFKVARHHYSLIKNCLAQQVNKAGQKIEVYNENGMWFLIDNSYNLNEAETIHNKSALIDSIGIQKYFNEHKETKFEVTPKFIMSGLSEQIKVASMIQQNQLVFAQNMESHIEAIQTLSKQVKRLSRVFKSTLIENRKLRLGSQKILGDWGI